MKALIVRVLGSGYTMEEYEQYKFEELADKDEVANFLSNRAHYEKLRPKVNSEQKHILEDKWVTQIFFSSLGLPMPPAIGVFHPHFGTTTFGGPMRTHDDLFESIQDLMPVKLVFKPRGGRQGRNIVVADFTKRSTGEVRVSSRGKLSTLSEFVNSLPDNVFEDYQGDYHGWLVQHYVTQHEFMLDIAPYSVNTFRVVTFVDANGICKVQLTVLRLGREGSTADNWDKGGLSVYVDPASGRLGQGVFKPLYGGQWMSKHPDSGSIFEGRVVPNWDSVLSVCARAAASLSGIRLVAWDIALTPAGPVILEGNADWSLPLVQVHSSGYLSDQVRADLKPFGLEFPTKLKPLMRAIGPYAVSQWRRSRGPRVLGKMFGRKSKTVG